MKISDVDPQRVEFRQGQKVVYILAKMKDLINDEIDPNYARFIQAYYLWGIKTSDSKLFSGKVKVNKTSRPYFERVIKLTENNENNIYRIFSQHWLKE